MNTSPRQFKHTFKKLSLKSRLLLAAAFWLSAMIFAAGIGIPKLVNDYLVQDVKSQLLLSMDEITANIEVNSKGNLIMPSRLSDPRFSQPYSGLYWAASTKGDELRSRSLWDKKLTFKEDGLSIKPKVKGANNEELIYIQKNIYLPEIKQPITITVGLDEDPLEKTLHQLTGQLWIILGLLFSGVLFLIGIQVSWSLRPLAKMQSELVMLRKGEQQALGQHYPQEIAPLVSDLNALLFHYQELLERARHHAGNLSHSLKTPLSVLKNELEYLNVEDKNRLSAPIAQLQAHIDYHLSRARMAGSMNILSVATSPSERVDAISMAFDKVYAEREVILINELDSEDHIAVDKTDLDEMLGNLLENGYKWAHSMIRVHSKDVEEHQIRIMIEDDGEGIPESEFEQVIKRGIRLDETTPGTGLGLNIVSEMAHSYRGSLELSKSAMGGLKATLTFPLVKE
uniref:histidine kinase n=1 Tax=Aliivibrio wodanis TaxID=80852 RepID=A0A5Q4ZX07_9GAMM|nr:Virulence sensor histidine kinase PhoQ [Aliivibrio wodanis]